MRDNVPSVKSQHQISICAALGVCLLVFWITLSGCAHADGPYNPTSEEKLWIDSQTPQKYSVQVTDRPDSPVGVDGRVVLEIPHQKRTSTVYVLGLLPVYQTSPYETTAIHVKKGDQTVRKFSLDDLKKLPLDNQGFRIVKVD